MCHLTYGQLPRGRLNIHRRGEKSPPLFHHQKGRGQWTGGQPPPLRALVRVRRSGPSDHPAANGTISIFFPTLPPLPNTTTLTSDTQRANRVNVSSPATPNSLSIFASVSFAEFKVPKFKNRPCNCTAWRFLVHSKSLLQFLF